jgi:hypothetical protein
MIWRSSNVGRISFHRKPNHGALIAGRQEIDRLFSTASCYFLQAAKWTAPRSAQAAERAVRHIASLSTFSQTLLVAFAYKLLISLFDI